MDSRSGTSVPAIVVGLVLGCLLGLLYGKQMWIATGGPQRRLQRLDKTIQQKVELIRKAKSEGNVAEARRLASQLPVLQEEYRRVKLLVESTRGRANRTAFVVFQLVEVIGTLFLRLLMLLVVPLVLTSVVCGVASIGSAKRLGKVGLWTVTYYAATTAIAVTIGLFLVLVIRPGLAADDTFAYTDPEWLQRDSPSLSATVVEVLFGQTDNPGSGMIPRNIFAAAAEGNVLAIIVFALFLGAAINVMGKKGEPLAAVFVAANDAIMLMVRFVVRFTPVGVFALVAAQIAKSGGETFLQEVARLGWLVLTVVLGLAVHAVILCIVLRLLGGQNPVVYIKRIVTALGTAFSTASSSATLPVTMECVEDAGVSPQSAGFVLPLGATINMDGTALYEAVAALFIAQTIGITFGPVELVLVFLTATLAAIGAPGIPNAGLVTLLIVLAAVQLPPAAIGTILAVDWFLDRLRTTVNVFGDAVGAAVIDRAFPPADD